MKAPLMVRFLVVGAACASLTLVQPTANAALLYTFGTDTEGFQTVSWQAASPVGWSGLPGTVRQEHTAGGWQMAMTHEFSWGAGGGSANQQLEMQALANTGNARLAFDAMVDGTSFPAGTAMWYQFNIAGNSGGAAGWFQQDAIIDGWHNADDPTLLVTHFDYSFAQLGWEPGDTWFQLWTGANSDADKPVNFYLDNVVLYEFGETIPDGGATFALLGLGLLALGTARTYRWVK